MVPVSDRDIKGAVGILHLDGTVRQNFVFLFLLFPGGGVFTAFVSAGIRIDLRAIACSIGTCFHPAAGFLRLPLKRDGDILLLNSRLVLDLIVLVRGFRRVLNHAVEVNRTNGHKTHPDFIASGAAKPPRCNYKLLTVISPFFFSKRQKDRLSFVVFERSEIQIVTPGKISRRTSTQACLE